MNIKHAAKLLLMVGGLLLASGVDAHNVTAAIPLPPTLVGPTSGVRTDSYEITLQWTYPAGSAITQVHLQVVPFNNDGPAIDIIKNANCCTNETFRIPPPPEWYGLLPDLTYAWKVRGTEATTSVGVDDASWGPWSPASTFKTPLAAIKDTIPNEPFNGANVADTPTLKWREVDPRVFYFEVQLSSDPTFNTDPATAITSVYWSLVHGGVSNPPNSYSVPPSAPLAHGKTYYWRVRPRIQGDGKPLDWSKSWEIRVP